MITSKLPDNAEAMVALIGRIAPDAEVERDAEDPRTIHLNCAGNSETITVVDDFEQQRWSALGRLLNDECGLLEVLCILFNVQHSDFPHGRLPGPDYIETLRMSAMINGDHDLAALCDRGLKTMDSAAILACSRALPNNDWRKHNP